MTCGRFVWQIVGLGCNTLLFHLYSVGGEDSGMSQSEWLWFLACVCVCVHCIGVCPHVCLWICAENGDDLTSPWKQYGAAGSQNLYEREIPEQDLAWDWYHWYSVTLGVEWQQKKKGKKKGGV